MKAFEHTREDSIYNVMISLIGFIIYYSVYDNYSTSIMNILLRKTTSNNSIFTNGES